MKLVLACLFTLVVLEAYLAPFTKVEESFNLQATHDIIHQASHYDHLDFPGVVPRTFLGATILSLIGWPFIHFFPLSPIDEQVLVRIILSAGVVFSLGKFASGGVRSLFGSFTAQITIALLVCQFHLVFWASRTLPNMFALPWVMMGLSHWLISLSQTSGRTYHIEQMIRFLTFSGIIFRFEAGIMLVILVGTEWLCGSITLGNSFKQTIVTAIISLIISVPLDSFFWNEWVWPEGMVFYFNAILNKSSDWGTLPFHAYFLSFLPRLLLISYPLSIIGFFLDSRVRRMLSPMIVYILIFSCLPHKEWRFIIYTIPVFTAAAAASVSSVITAAHRSQIQRVASVAIVLGALASFAISIIMFQISRLNYPGGEALYTLHEIENNTPYVSVHMDADTAMTGASLYGQSNPHWSYSKNESHSSEEDFLKAHYTHIITSTPEKFDKSIFEVIDQTYGLDKVSLKSISEYMKSLRSMDISPISFKMSPKLFTLKLIQPQNNLD
ncbi:Alg9-like mannosyltransferase family-domain-containing protein [Mucor mucedo]|uniref:Alg9-like mannosyltransferase family-domain-containing protein n=1 Tax=Mucor mucedo TaxID=29922 RepID=UPI00221EACC8|nr:Alg9-like mannosyltransferase family-domain-containing protein [Mucor mucedo]KAI7885945.1 Alg9-like mannosyltransferase family-domain-containing protein [Mucor mucedo]